MFQPELKTDNFGAHSPPRYYNTIEPSKKVTRKSVPYIKQSPDVKFSVPKNDRMLLNMMSSRTNVPGPGEYITGYNNITN